MAYDIAALSRLSQHFEKLPGIGRKTAQRLAFFVLSMPEEQVRDFADAMIGAKKEIHLCSVCQNITDSDVCSICSSNARNRSLICVVEEPKDVIAFERTRRYNGLYHVLHGAISPMDGITPDKLRIKELLSRIDDDTKEIIMATNPSLEGEATALYLSRLIKPFGVKVSRLAYGIPVGSTLEYADDDTLSRALNGRNEL